LHVGEMMGVSCFESFEDSLRKSGGRSARMQIGDELLLASDLILSAQDMKPRRLEMFKQDRPFHERTLCYCGLHALT
jgi:hypothetical protein